MEALCPQVCVCVCVNRSLFVSLQCVHYLLVGFIALVCVELPGALSYQLSKLSGHQLSKLSGHHTSHVCTLRNHIIKCDVIKFNCFPLL